MKPDRDVSINLHNRVTMRYVLGDFTETPAAKQNYENTDGQMQAGVALGESRFCKNRICFWNRLSFMAGISSCVNKKA